MSIWTKIAKECFQHFFKIYATKNQGRFEGKTKANEVAGETNIHKRLIVQWCTGRVVNHNEAQ